jgi:mRNA-degrading endonuclease RelE of RelBE toxin-antitoxin system
LIFDVVFSHQADRDGERLSSAVRARVEAAIDRLALTGRGDVQPLTGAHGEFRLRMGDVRVLFHIDLDNGWLIVDRILPRGRAYRDL